MADSERVILLCTQDESVLESIEALGAVGYRAVRCSTLRELQLELGEAVVAAVLDASLPKDQAFGMYRFLRKEGTIPFLVLLPPPSGDQPSWVMEVEHGEHEDFARQPISIPELVMRLNALLIRSGGVAPNALSFSVANNPQAAATFAGFGKVICVFGAHGGVGKTTVAVHLAVGLARFKEARVAFVDGDLWMGDATVSLNVTASRTILDATGSGVPNDPEVWTRVLMDHPSGVKVLAPPVHLEDVERVPEGALSAAAQGLRRYFDFVIVDLDDTPNEATLSVLEVADQVLVVLTPELGAVRNTMRLLTTSSDIGLKERVRLVVNRSDSGLDAKQIESIIPGPVAAHIPSDGHLFVAAANAGLTIFDIEKASRSPARRAMEGLVTDVAEYGRPKVTRQRSGMFGNFAGLGRR